MMFPETPEPVVQSIFYKLSGYPYEPAFDLTVMGPNGTYPKCSFRSSVDINSDPWEHTCVTVLYEMFDGRSSRLGCSKDNDNGHHPIPLSAAP